MQSRDYKTSTRNTNAAQNSRISFLVRYNKWHQEVEDLYTLEFPRIRVVLLADPSACFFPTLQSPLDCNQHDIQLWFLGT